MTLDFPEMLTCKTTIFELYFHHMRFQEGGTLRFAEMRSLKLCIAEIQAEEKNVDGSKCFEVKKAPLKRKRGMSKASKSALLSAIEEEDIEQPAEQKNVDGSKCIAV